MKEKLIAFTRNKENRVKLIIANAIIFAIIIVASLFFDITKINIVVRAVIRISLILIVFGNYVVSKLFDINENVIRNNKMPIIFLAYSDITYLILIIIWLLMTKGTISNFIIIIPTFIIFMLISECVSGYYRKKIKIE